MNLSMNNFIRNKIIVAKESFRRASKRQSRKGELPFYETYKMTRKDDVVAKELPTTKLQTNNDEMERKKSRVKSILGSFYRRTDKPIVHFQRPGEDNRN